MAPPRRFLLALALVFATALAAAAAAQADIVVAHDPIGRSITFDVRAPSVDVDWYASLLRSAPHGNEISAVTIRIVPLSDITGVCGADAIACYGSRTIIVPAGHDAMTAHALVHEYGHHLDTAWPVAGAPELNGTPVWWAARGIAALLAQGTVAYGYSLGWDHSIPEVFAEDYAYTDLGGYYGIPWLSPPDAALQSALLTELGGKSTTPATPPTSPATTSRPVVVFRTGALAPRRRRVLPFQLLGLGRRVTFTAKVSGSWQSRARARLEVVCDGSPVASTTLAKGEPRASLDMSNLGPASCEAALVSTSSRTLYYSLQLRLAVQQP